MSWHLCNLDIDGTITAQTGVSHQIHTKTNLRDHEDNLRLWPSKKSLAVVREHVRALQSEDRRNLIFYGSGDLNHLSAVFVEELPAATDPVHLILFDNHPDWFLLPPRYHCGNWVGTLLKNNRIASATLIGQCSDDLNGINFWFAPWYELLTGRVEIIPYEKNDVHVPLRTARGWNLSGTALRFDSVLSMGMERLSKKLEEKFSGKNVYIAIDKDVLRSEDATSDWEQGKLSLSDLLALISTISRSSNVVGADVCGDKAERPLAGLLKKLDAGRLSERPVEQIQASVLNEKANLAIMQALLNSRPVLANQEVAPCLG